MRKIKFSWLEESLMLIRLCKGREGEISDILRLRRIEMSYSIEFSGMEREFLSARDWIEQEFGNMGEFIKFYFCFVRVFK